MCCTKFTTHVYVQRWFGHMISENDLPVWAIGTLELHCVRHASLALRIQRALWNKTKKLEIFCGLHSRKATPLRDSPTTRSTFIHFSIGIGIIHLGMVYIYVFPIPPNSNRKFALQNECFMVLLCTHTHHTTVSSGKSVYIKLQFPCLLSSKLKEIRKRN